MTPDRLGSVDDTPTGPIALPAPRWRVAAPRRWGRVLAAAAIAASVGMSIAAITVTLTRTPPPAPEAAPMTTTVVSGPVGGPADKALCEAITSVVTDEAQLGINLTQAAAAGRAEFDAAIPGYKSAIRDWAARINPVLDAHPNASGYLTRGLHRFVDSDLAYAVGLTPGLEVSSVDRAAWTNSLVGLGAAQDVCSGVGVDL